MSEIRIVELFAGIGGFRLGLEKNNSDKFKFKTVYANQWEPKTKKQHAAEIYIKNFGEENFSNEPIQKIKYEIPNHDLLVGGFPCQDYSVAKSGAKGLQGEKGALWWEIYDIIKSKKPKLVLLENVDRLVKLKNGEHFKTIIKCFEKLNYKVEWKIINAAEYGFLYKKKTLVYLSV